MMWGRRNRSGKNVINKKSPDPLFGWGCGRKKGKHKGPSGRGGKNKKRTSTIKGQGRSRGRLVVQKSQTKGKIPGKAHPKVKKRENKASTVGGQWSFLAPT